MVAEKSKRKDIYAQIPFDGGITAEIKDGHIILHKNNQTLKRVIERKLQTKIENNMIIIETKKSTKKEKRIFGTLKAHIKNMIKGLNEGFKYKLQIANVHFPMTATFDKAKSVVIVKNFLGEKKDRIIPIAKGVDVKINKSEIEVTSFDIEHAGQSAANIEKGTKVRKRDRRIFQDGIFITHKPKRTFI
jgi:large subunit ribosomal protein L6